MVINVQLNDYLEFKLGYVVAGQQCMNVFHYQVTAPVSGSVDCDPAALLDDWDTGIWDAGSGHGLYRAFSEDATDCTISVQRLTRGRTRLVFKQLGTPVGGVVSPALPPTVSMVIKRTTDLSGPNQQGRIFTGGVPTSYVTDGELSATAITWLEAEADILVGTIHDSTQPTFAAKAALFTPDGVNELNRFITTVGWDLPLRVQRRREVGLGQ